MVLPPYVACQVMEVASFQPKGGGGGGGGKGAWGGGVYGQGGGGGGRGCPRLHPAKVLVSKKKCIGKMEKGEVLLQMYVHAS